MSELSIKMVKNGFIVSLGSDKTIVIASVELGKVIAELLGDVGESR